MQRRAALHLIALGATWPVAGHWLSAELEALGVDVHTALATQETVFRALDPAAVALVLAACDRIIPADDTPGAIAADVPRFIDTIMADWEEPGERDRWLAGLATLDRDAAARHGRRFTDCTIAEQEAMLTALDEEVAALSSEDRAAHWFGRLKSLTVYGYCTSEVGMRQELGTYPLPGRYDGNAPHAPRRQAGAAQNG